MSWVIIEKESGLAVCELFNKSSVDRLNAAKYEALEAGKYLCELNKKLNNGLTYKDKIEKGLI